MSRTMNCKVKLASSRWSGVQEKINFLRVLLYTFVPVFGLQDFQVLGPWYFKCFELAKGINCNSLKIPYKSYLTVQLYTRRQPDGKVWPEFI